LQFKLLNKDPHCNARVGEIKTSRGIITTPVFMPVATKGTIKALTLKDIEKIGFEIILTNTYHLYIRPGIEILKEAGGIHSFMNFNKPILTDSGGFQVFSLSNLCTISDNGVEFKSHLDGSRHFFSPKSTLDIQKIIGSDIMMVLDQCCEHPITFESAENAVNRTINWAKDSINHWKEHFDTEKQSLFAIVQGSTFEDLRKKCAEILVELDFPGYAIGGLSVGEPKHLYKEMTELTLKYLPNDKPRYMMGVGSPIEILFAIMNGVDMFDCVMPTRIARNGTVYTSRGRVNIKASIYAKDFTPLDENCSCYVCKNFTKAYLRHIFKIGEITSLIYNSYHNLYFMKNFLDEIRESIQKGIFLSTFQKWKSLYERKDLE